MNVCQSMDEYTIRIKKLKLEDEGIKCIIFDQRDSSYNAFGYLYLQVQSADEAIAREILEESDE